MNIKKTAKKIVAVGAGFGLAGATLMGALAAPDLAQYPSDFMEDGQFDGRIVVGANAAPEDIIGSIDIAASLQAASSPGSSGTAPSVSGEAFQVGDSGDILELYEEIDDVINTLTSDDLGILAGGRITTQEGSTDYRQVIRFLDGGDASVVYDKDDEEDEIGYYLNIKEGNTIQYELSFPSGLKSESDSGSLEDFEDEMIVFMGQEYSIVNADLDSSGELTLDLIAGDVSDTLEQGQSRTYTVDGVDYEITVAIVGEGNDPEVRFIVNGDSTRSLEEGETETLEDGTEIGVREIVQQSRAYEGAQGSIVEFYIGANQVTLQEGGIEVGDEDINDASITFDDNNDGSDMDGDTYSLRTITYTVDFQSAEGSEMWIGEGQTLSEWLDEPGSLLNPHFDIRFEGVTQPSTSMIEFSESGDDEYELSFMNQRGDEYDVPFAHVDGTTVKFGEEDGGDGFFFFEHVNITGVGPYDVEESTFQISVDDFFVLTDNEGIQDEDADSWVYSFDEVDTDDETITFIDEASNDEVEEQYTAANVLQTTDLTGLTSGDSVPATGQLTVSGIDYDFWIYNNSGTFELAIDMNSDGLLAGEDMSSVTAAADTYEIVDIVTHGGGILKLHDDDTELPVLGSGVLTAQLTTVADDLDEGSNETQTIAFSDTNTTGGDEEFDGVTVSGGTPAINMVTDDGNDDRDVGVNRYGTWFEVNGDDAPNVEIRYPSEQVEALVYVLGGDATITSGMAGGAGGVLDIGLAVFDNEVEYDDENFIVVGGPCANTMAAELLGNPTDCLEGFEEGMGMIQTFETGDNVAVLVAGYGPRETVESSRVLAQAATGTVQGLSGESVEVVVAGESQTSVRSAQ